MIKLDPTRPATCVSLWQPWAGLLACGAKEYETRSWPTKHRGPLVVHAAKKWGPEQHMLTFASPFIEAIEEAGLDMTLGAIVGVVDLAACVPTSRDFRTTLSRREEAFGDFSPGRFAWKAASAVLLPRPIPFPGGQRLFHVPHDVVRLINSQLAEVA